MKAIINENERGFLFKNGQFQRMLGAGKYRFFGKGYDVIFAEAEGIVDTENYDKQVFLGDKMFVAETVTVDVADQTVAFHYEDERFVGVLTAGSYTFWNVFSKHRFEEMDICETEVSEEISTYMFKKISTQLYTKVEVSEFQKALVYFDQKLEKVLDEGTYYFWNNGTKIQTHFVDTRILQMDVTGQEIMTFDKVSLRINFVCNYRVTDVVKIHTEIEDFQEQIHIQIQLALREYVGKYRLDEILENKDKISNFVFNQLKEKEEAYYVTVYNAGVKDIILPGEIRDIMNTVLLAEKRAQANVITRREEVASTRSLLNTAKLMEENQTLYKLKELEHLEKICENVGNITVSGGSDLLAQLTTVLKGS